MEHYTSTGYRIFTIINYMLLTLVSITCVLPIVHMIAVSLSSSAATNANLVGLWPIGFTWESYEKSFGETAFLSAYGITAKRIVLGTGITMILTFLMAYPLSKSSARFPLRNVYVWILVFTMLFSGGLIPTYILISRLDMMDTIWALVLPQGVNVFFIILLLNFFRQVPKDIEESAFIDGASWFKALISIYIPLSLPAIATLTLFSAVFHWNSWFDGLIYMNNVELYPLQTYLQLLLEKSKAALTMEEAKVASITSRRSVYSAQIILAMLPIIVFYPYLQKYFTKGIVLGSVKE